MKWLALLLSVALFQPAAEPSLDTLLDRLSAYLLRYESIITEVIADEDMAQRDKSGSAMSRIPYRKLQSEVAFMRLPGDGEWIGFRLVQTVDGRRVREQTARLQLLLSGSGDDQRRGLAIAQESAKHNLGLPRTTNMPLLAFEFLHPRNRARLAFQRRGLERINGRQTRRIDFSETVSPTIIHGPRGGDLRSRGSVWIVEATGAVHQTVIRDDAALSPFLMRVTFSDDAALGILVPTRMWETFPVGRGVGEGDARYSNFRRFTTSARIVPQ